MDGCRRPAGRTAGFLDTCILMSLDMSIFLLQKIGEETREMKKRTILDEAQITRSLTRISHEILERNKGTEGLVFLGVKTRGEFLADRLQKKVEEIDGVTIPTGTLDITA